MIHEQQRQRVFEVAKSALIVLSAYDEMQLSGDMVAPFLQESSFWWLTGIEEAGWKLILDGSQKKSTLVRPARSQVDVVFNGRMTDRQVREVSRIDRIIDIDDFEKELRQLRRHHSIVQTIDNIHYGDTMHLNPAQNELNKTLKRIFDSVQSCNQMIAGLRAIKQPEELKCMQKAIDVTTRAFQDVREILDSCRSENEIEAEFTHRFRRADALHAYEPIVASGKNACTLHYIANNAKVGARDMVLIDIGARVDGYSADITRTYCRNPTKRQRAVHEAVLKAQKKVIALISPGLPVSEYVKKGDMIMREALHDLGLLDDLSDDSTFRKYFPHAMSHGLGVDTHDSLGSPRCLEVGMVITVEPGIYIEEEGIGVRIEDDILVTNDGSRNLSGVLSTAL